MDKHHSGHRIQGREAHQWVLGELKAIGNAPAPPKVQWAVENWLAAAERKRWRAV